MGGDRTAARIFSSVSSPRNLRKVYHDEVRNGVSRGRDGIQPEALIAEIGPITSQISDQLRRGIYKFTTFRELLISKGARKYPRIISVPTARDRIVLKSLSKLLGEVFPESKGGRPQPLIEKFTKQLFSNAYDSYIRIDIREFYPSINHTSLTNILKVKIRKSEILKLIIAAISNNTLSDHARRSRTREAIGVPQGLPISNILAEIYLKGFDANMRKAIGKGYFRYVDDIIILCSSSRKLNLQNLVSEELATIGLVMHPLNEKGSKSHAGLITERIEYLGYEFRAKTISVRRSSIEGIESALARVFTQFSHSRQDPSSSAIEAQRIEACLWHLNLKITGFMFEGESYGWLRYFSQLNDLKLLKQRDASVKRLVQRFGLPPDFHPKTFMRTYWYFSRGKYPWDGYIPDLTNLSIDEIRRRLEFVYEIRQIDRMNDEAVKVRWRQEVQKEKRLSLHDVRRTS